MNEGNRGGQGDGFVAKAGEAVRGLFAGGGAETASGSHERRYRQGEYVEAAGRGPQPYPMGDANFWGTAPAASGQSSGQGQGTGGASDRHYHEARARHLEAFDRDYDTWHREHGGGGPDFASWHAERQGQRHQVSRVRERMDVVCREGTHLGTAHGVDGEHIVMARPDPAGEGVAPGPQRRVPAAWVHRVDDDKVVLNRGRDETHRGWDEADRNERALDERGAGGSGGPHILERSFSGTYDKD